MDDMLLYAITGICYFLIFLVFWLVFERIMEHFLDMLMPWVPQAGSAILAALFVWKFCNVKITF